MNHYRYEDLTIGLAAGFSVCVTAERMAQFFAVCGDVNPLHMDEPYARARGFDGRLVYGMLTASFYSTLCGVYLPGERCLLQELAVQFGRPVYIGDTLVVTGAVTARMDAYKRVEIKAKIVNQAGVRVSAATIKAGVRDE